MKKPFVPNKPRAELYGGGRAYARLHAAGISGLVRGKDDQAFAQPGDAFFPATHPLLCVIQ